MSSQAITRVHVSNINRGDWIIEEDAEELTDEQINADWQADEQDWQHVIHSRHQADQSTLTLAMYNGETYQAGPGDGFVWRLVDSTGEPVNDEPEA